MGYAELVINESVDLGWVELLTCFAIIPQQKTRHAQDEYCTGQGECENETDSSKERDVGFLRLEFCVLVQLQGAHDSWKIAVGLGRQREHRQCGDAKR